MAAGGAVAIAALASQVAHGQTLRRFGPTSVAEASRAGGSVVTSCSVHAVQVDLDLLRSDPPLLEVPTPGGRVFAVERTVFEDRGDGDLTWSGRVQGAEYDTVVLTVEDSHLMGRVAEPAASGFLVAANRSGRGRMIDAVRCCH